MTQNDVVHNAVTLDRRAFLQALYHNAPDDLLLELRLIHPTTKMVKTLWSPLADKKKLARIFNEADKLNREGGYGLYFAPCLRHTEQGKVEAAALVPALWVDIDCGDGAPRERAMERLHTFDPAPSAILDSGGGLHAYWLLDTPFLTPDAAARDEVAARLRGLFAAVGGDEAYVKTVAGIMRLPQSVNTKPDRGGVIATILELHPDRRYPFSAFAWLKADEKRAWTPTLTHRVVDANGHRRLSQRTEHYLTYGAPPDNRNKELFAAACDMRDAGYSQGEAEQRILPRFLADGHDEIEGRKSIASAFSRPPREPLPEHPRAKVEQLISSYRRTETTTEHPTAAQIAEVVRACAALDPVEWTEERQRLKSVCGDIVKLKDLDQLYKEARRQITRSSRSTVEETERYLTIDGAMLYERQTSQGTRHTPVADWLGQVVEVITQVEDDGQVEHVTRLRVEKGSKQAVLDVPAELFGDPNGLARFIAGRAGGMFSPRAGMHKHLAPAILKLSPDAPERQTYRFMGWSLIDGKQTYLTPEGGISAAGIMAKPPEVALEHRLRDYGLGNTSWDDGIAAFNAAVQVFPKHLAPTLIAFSMLPLLQRFFPSAAPKPALHLVGTTGSGKSEIAALMTSFYGRFHRDAPPAQWGDTVNTVETLGYSLADALYWVDDYKTIYADERTFTRFLQSYSREMGRGRLTREAKLRQERPCRGLLLSTGETTLEGEASILSRMLVLEVPPWEKRDPGGKLLAAADALREHLAAFTAEFAAWIAAQADDGSLMKTLSRSYAGNTAAYRANLKDKLGRHINTGRLTDSWAVLLSVYQFLHDFLVEKDADDHFPPWQDAALATIQSVQEERAGRKFLDRLAQLIASGRVMLATNLQMPEEPRPGTTIVGYQVDKLIYLIPDIAVQEVTKVAPLKFSASDIGKQLEEESFLIPGKNSITVQRRIRGNQTRLWQLKSDFLTCDDCDSVTNG